MTAEDGTHEQNEKLVRRFFDAWDKGDYSGINELTAPDYKFYQPSGSNEPKSREETIAVREMLQKAFPDITFRMEELYAVGDSVIFRFTQEGTHRGELNGTAATGNRIHCSGIIINHIRNGKIIEQREEFDEMSLMLQLGMTLKPEQAES